MSYLDRKHTSNRTATIIAVTAIEAAAIFAVVRGLTVEFTRSPAPTPLEAEQIRLDPPPAPLPSPHPTPSAQPSHQPDHTIHSRVDLGTGPILPLRPEPMPTASPMPQPTPIAVIERPQFAPRAARALGRPSGWATSNDYPARDLREGNAGVTGFRLTIGSDGRVQSCAITMSSGFPGLDRATCDNVSRRARFEPATDGTGAKVPGSYANSIHWVFPD